MNRSELARIARAMVAKGKGILAADESSGTIKKRFDGIKLESTEEARRTYREMLFTAPGVPGLHQRRHPLRRDLRQKTKDGVPFPDYLTKLGIIPGIKVDTGAKPLAGFPNETITEGLDGLRERLVEYHKLGARFAKWRAVIDIARRHSHAVRHRRECACAGALRGALPGKRHRADRRARSADGRRPLASSAARKSRSVVLESVFDQLYRTPHLSRRHGAEAEHGDLGQEGRESRLAGSRCRSDGALLKRHVPSAVPGIAFLSGGQSSPEATLHLSLMNKLGPLPWAAHVQLRPRAAGHGAEGLGRQGREFRCRPEGVREAREAQRPCDHRPATRPPWRARPPEAGARSHA